MHYIAANAKLLLEAAFPSYIYSRPRHQTVVDLVIGWRGENSPITHLSVTIVNVSSSTLPLHIRFLWKLNIYGYAVDAMSHFDFRPRV